MKIEGTSIQIEGTADAKVLRQKKAWAVSREQQGNQCCGVRWELSQRDEEGRVDPNSCLSFYSQ